MLKIPLFPSCGSNLTPCPLALLPRTDVKPDPKESPDEAADASSLPFSLSGVKVDPRVNCCLDLRKDGWSGAGESDMSWSLTFSVNNDGCPKTDFGGEGLPKFPKDLLLIVDPPTLESMVTVEAKLGCGVVPILEGWELAGAANADCWGRGWDPK
jgi:hypothetical protein